MAEQGSMTGKVFGSRYQINDRIGIGGMAEVYRAQDTVLGRNVAVKVMLPQYAGDADFTRRFRQEAAAAANLQSPYIVNVYDWGQEGDTYYIVMEFVRGGDLKTAIKQRGAINQRKVAEIGSQVCQALNVAHKQDIIHRDIKPQNIMVQPDGNVKVMDFGIARSKNSINEQTSSVLGTAHYISPEQAQGKELTAASDIYSLGVVLYEAATGKLPFDGPDAMSVALMQVKDYPVPPSEINPDIDPALEDIIMCAMEKNPRDRFATANDMRMALNDYLACRTNANNGFTSAQTQVIAPAAATAAAAEATRIMSPVNKDASEENTTVQTSDSSSEETKKKSRKGPIIAIICVVAAVAVIAVVAYGFAAGWFAGNVTVPDVVGKSQLEATLSIEAEGLEVGDVTQSYSDTVAEGLVISQDPKGNSSVSKDTKVSLVISQGAQMFTVPDVVGMTQSSAKQAIEVAGLEVGNVTEEYSDTVDEGLVISQDPGADAEVGKGTQVSFVVSKGADLVEVPYVVGYEESSARSTLSNAGLTVNVDRDYSDDINSGNVISQSISSGTRVARGSSITIVVSRGKNPSVEVPSVVGLSEERAASILSDAGLYYAVNYTNSDTVSVGLVISQSPSANSTVNNGTTITITVSEGPAASVVEPEPTDETSGSGSYNPRGSTYDDENEDEDEDEDEDESSSAPYGSNNNRPGTIYGTDEDE